MSRRGQPTEIDFFRELCLDTDGRPGQGRMILTIARRLGIQVSQAEELARRTAELGLVDLSFGSVALSYEGWKRLEDATEKEEAPPPARPPSHRKRA